MSKQSEQKESQGYVLNAPPKNCGSCSNFAMTVTRESNQYGNFTKESNLRCTVGDFAVKKAAVCLLFMSKGTQ